MVNVEKVGKCILHILNRPVKDEVAAGIKVTGKLDEERRSILRNHHSATHIVFASCRNVLGPHVWQAGAKKTVD